MKALITSLLLYNSILLNIQSFYLEYCIYTKTAVVRHLTELLFRIFTKYNGIKCVSNLI